MISNKITSILFYLTLLFFPIAFFVQNNDAGIYKRFILLGLFGIVVYYIASLIKGYKNKYSLSKQLFSIVAILMSITLYMRYYNWKVWDIPGFIIVPFFLIYTIYYIKQQMDSDKIYFKSVFTFAAFTGLSVPLFISIENGPRKFIPYEYLPQSINFAGFRNDKYYWFIPEGKKDGRWVPKSNYTQIEDGKFTGFYWNGKLREEGTVVNNKIIDTQFVYDLNEKIIKYLIHSKDTVIQYYLYNGKFKDFFSDGKLFEEGIVENHRVGPEWKSYYNSGTIQSHSYMLDGVKIRKGNYENGQIHYSGKEKNGVVDGRVTYYYENGQIQAVCDWKDGKQHGERITFFMNGQVETKDYFENGKAEGESIIYYENGNMKQRRYFKKDIANGELTDWHENGNIKYEGFMNDGMKSGIYHSYDEKERIKQIGNYKKGKAHGLFQNYDSTGVVEASVIYKEGEVDKFHFNNYKK